MKKGKKFSKASKSSQYIAQNINATASARPTWPHNYPQLFPQLNGKLKAEKGTGGVSSRKLLTLTFPLYTVSGSNTASSAAAPVNQKQVQIQRLGMLFYQKQTSSMPAIYRPVANIQTFSIFSSEIKVPSTC